MTSTIFNRFLRFGSFIAVSGFLSSTNVVTAQAPHNSPVNSIPTINTETLNSSNSNQNTSSDKPKEDERQNPFFPALGNNTHPQNITSPHSQHNHKPGNGESNGNGQRRRQRPKFDPLNPDVHDPVMAYEDGKFYIFATGMLLASLESEDMRSWQQMGHVMNEVPQWALESFNGYRGHTWAPDIQKVGDTWYMYYSCSSFGKNLSAIGLLTNKTLDRESEDYQWVDQGLVVQSLPGVTDWNAIDPNLILDEEGNPWLNWGSFWDGIQLVQLDKDFKTPLSLPKTIARRRPAIQKSSEDSINNNLTDNQDNTFPEIKENAIEAPFIIRSGDFYYLFASWDYCCRGEDSTYKTVVGRSTNIEGPYLDPKGIDMRDGGGLIIAGGDEQYYGIGHSSAYNIDGQWYFLAHGYSIKDNGFSKLVVKKMGFDSEGWPVLSSLD